MKGLSLFSGIGGIDIAAHLAGIETVAFCEREPFPQKVLQKNFPGIPIYDDVCTLTKERLEQDGIDTATIGLIHGGYPCQPFSIAGKRKGEEDDRFLWKEVLRLIEEIRPCWFVGENVAGHISLGLDGVLSDLESIGYTCEPIVLPACSVGALHRRDRVFIIAHSNSKRTERNFEEKIQGEPRLQSSESSRSIEDWARRSMLFEPKLLRNHNGFPDGMDRLKSLGNAVVPQQIYPILAAIKVIDDSLGGIT